MPSPRSIRRRLGVLAMASAALAVPLAGSAAAEEGMPERAQVMAKLGPGENPYAVASRTGLRLESWLPQISWASYSYSGTGTTAHRRLLGDRAVWRIDFAAPGERFGPAFTPRDTIFLQPGSAAAGGLTASWNWHWTITNFPAAWDIARGEGVKVAVIDSEFDTEHIELKPKLLSGRNFDSGTPEYRTGNIRATANDLATLHGTHVAGLVGAVTDNGNGVPGACFDCVVAPYKISLRGGVTGAPETTDAKFVRDLTEALVDVASRTDVRVVNMSLGTTRPHQPMQDAINLALSKGKVLIAASGNDQLSQPGVPHYPASYAGVIGVGATQPDDNIAPFSSNGDYVDISAPGHGIVSTWDQRVSANAPPPIQPATHGAGFTNLSGTSMASPMVAGLAGLMLQLRPELTAGEIEQLLARSAVDLGAPGRDQVFGAGRIDAAAALEATRAYVRPATGPPPLPKLSVTVLPPKRDTTARISVTKRQLRINQRISQAAILRLKALDARIEGRPIPSTKLRDKGVRFRLTRGQLAINQRIAEASLNRANAMIARLERRPKPSNVKPKNLALSVAGMQANQRTLQAAIVRVNGIKAALTKAGR